ncbi:MAG: flagellar hook-associated protein FlgK [Chitinivibrionia bacterium]|nr:flagellar hook-associated protein FlgK [Chitinivibrionia bacterium]
MSLFATMNLANSALHASQLGINVAGHNIANADRPGFSRQRVEQHAMYRRSAPFGQQGFGVTVSGITRIRNEFIDTQIRRQSFELGKHRAIDSALESMENIVREPSDTGIQEFMNRFFNSWDTLAQNPADISARRNLIANADVLVDVFRNVASELHNLKTSRNADIVSVVGEINIIARDIFNLNTEISIAEANGGNANDSRDRRDFLMRRLAELTDYDYITDSTGQVSISMNGHILVSAVSVNTVEIFSPPNVITDSQGFAQFGLRMVNGRGVITPSGGELAGLFAARDVFIPNMERQLDQLAAGLVAAVNEQHREGFNLRGQSGFNFFDPQGITARTISVSTGITTDPGNIAAAGGGGIMSDLRRNEIPAGGMSPIGTPFLLSTIDGSDGWNSTTDHDTDRARNLVAGTVVVSMPLTPPGSGQIQLVEGRDFRVDYVLGTIQLLADQNGVNQYEGVDLEISFRFVTGGFEGEGGNMNALAIYELRRAPLMGNTNIFGNPTSTFSEFYAASVAQLGLDRREATANVNTRQFLIDGYDEHQDSIAGVSLDEEAANIMRLQYSYQAAARIFSSVQSMLDILLNL